MATVASMKSLAFPAIDAALRIPQQTDPLVRILTEQGIRWQELTETHGPLAHLLALAAFNYQMRERPALSNRWVVIYQDRLEQNLADIKQCLEQQ